MKRNSSQSPENSGMPQSLLIQAGPMRVNILGGISDMTLYRMLNNPEINFPRPIRIGQRRFWRQSEVLAWVDSREVSQ